MTSTPPTERSKRLGWLPWMLVPLAFLAHAPALGAGYVLDDQALLVQNPFVRDWAGLGEMLTHELFAASAEYRNVPYYRPAAGLLYWASWQILGTSAPLQHALNILLHGLVATVLVSLLETLGVRRTAAMLAGGVVLVHPVVPEIVAYVGGRQDMLGWLFVLVGALVLTRRRLSPLAGASVVCIASAGAALSREFFVTAPLLLMPLACLHGEATARRRHLLASSISGVAAIAGVFVLRHLLTIQRFEFDWPGMPRMLGMLAGVFLRFVRVTLWPTDVAVYVTVATPAWWWAVATILAALGVAAVLVRSAQRVSVSAAVLAFIGCSIVVLSVVLSTPVVLEHGALADRYAYGVVLGLAIVVAALSGLLPRVASKVERPWLWRGLVVIAIASVLPMTWARSAAWRDEASLQKAMIRDRPEDPQSNLAWGMRLFASGESEAAYPYCLAFAEARPDVDQANYCLASVHFTHQRYADAAQLLRPYVLARPGQGSARVMLFRSLFAINDLEGVADCLDNLQPLVATSQDLQAAVVELERRIGAPSGQQSPRR